MKKEKLMEFLSEAIDKGFNIHVSASQFDKSKDWKPVAESEALRFAVEFKEAIGEQKVIAGERNNHCSHFQVGEAFGRFYGVFNHSPKGYLSEDVDLSGNLGQKVDEYA